MCWIKNRPRNLFVGWEIKVARNDPLKWFVPKSDDPEVLEISSYKHFSGVVFMTMDWPRMCLCSSIEIIMATWLTWRYRFPKKKVFNDNDVSKVKSVFAALIRHWNSQVETVWANPFREKSKLLEIEIYRRFCYKIVFEKIGFFIREFLQTVSSNRCEGSYGGDSVGTCEIALGMLTSKGSFCTSDRVRCVYTKVSRSRNILTESNPVIFVRRRRYSAFWTPTATALLTKKNWFQTFTDFFRRKLNGFCTKFLFIHPKSCYPTASNWNVWRIQRLNTLELVDSVMIVGGDSSADELYIQQFCLLNAFDRIFWLENPNFEFGFLPAP